MESSTPTTFNPDSPAVQKVLSRLRNPYIMWWYFFQKLPTLIWWRVRIQEITPDHVLIRLPFSWRTQNPFRSTYFAAQSGAAELSSGLLAMIALAGREPVSMLVTNVSSSFSKKVDSVAFFECIDGNILQKAIQKAIETGQGQQVTVQSIARLANGQEVSKTTITWSFKRKSNR